MRTFAESGNQSVYDISFGANDGSSPEWVVKRLESDITELLAEMDKDTPDWHKVIVARIGMISLAGKIDALKKEIEK